MARFSVSPDFPRERGIEHRPPKTMAHIINQRERFTRQQKGRDSLAHLIIIGLCCSRCPRAGDERCHNIREKAFAPTFSIAKGIARWFYEGRWGWETRIDQ